MSLRKITACVALLHAAVSDAACKNHPLDSRWPSIADWKALNESTEGALIQTSPVASSCYPGSPFTSGVSCDDVSDNWHLSSFHANQPESIGYPYWANNSCVPPTDYAYKKGQSCEIGGLPFYVLNTTNVEHIATATAWASSRDIRIVVKGTGHDLNGRSSGAHSLSIWTHHLRNLSFDTAWPHPLGNRSEKVVITGSGNNWGDILDAAAKVGRTVVSGQDPTVGLGGFIGGGGHGPLSSRYGLAADQILQATVVTTQGEILVANSAQNQDLLWAIRGGGPGLYGVVVEYVMRTYPVPKSAVLSTLSINMVDNSTDCPVSASWKALAALTSALPDLMDAGITGNGNAITRDLATNSTSSRRGIEVGITLFGYEMSTEELRTLLKETQNRIIAYAGNSALSISLSDPKSLPSYSALISELNPVPSHSSDIALTSSRLLGRAELTSLPLSTLEAHLQNITRTQIASDSCRLAYGLQGGPGPRSVDTDMRGALNPAWRKAYLHVLSTGAIVDTSGSVSPQAALEAASKWTEENKEIVWREWAPGSGAYINEANPFNGAFKEDFYGDSYERLEELKMRFDPTASLWVQSGVASEGWRYDLDSGLLCEI